jgi:uncharacterized membrane protein (DUF4010 family)
VTGHAAAGAFLLDLLVTVAAGALLGIEREHRRDRTRVIAGVRTFPLIAVAGFLVATLEAGVPGPLVAVGLAVLGLMAVAFFNVRHRLGVTGLTTPVAMIVTFLVGVLVASGLRLEAATVAVVATVLLLTKRRLHRFAEVLTEDEIMSALQFITVAFILFPFAARLEGPIPGTRGLVGPGELFDPYKTLLLVVFVSSLSFASFLAMRLVGPHQGVEVSGLLGGLVNSEATAASLATTARERPELVASAVVGAFLATTTMFVRNVAIAAFADPSLEVAIVMVPALGLMTVAGGVILWRRWPRDRPAEGEPVEVDSPFAVGPALRFALLFSLLWAAAKLAQANVGTLGVLATALGGFVSAGAAVASVAGLYASASTDISLAVAAQTAILATVVGAFNKLLVLRATNQEVYERARLPFAGLTLVGVVGLAATVLMI